MAHIPVNSLTPYQAPSTKKSTSQKRTVKGMEAGIQYIQKLYSREPAYE